ncbi:DUF6531 domain-containing protein [Lysobacter sp. BMK333-48F3]|uniref:RHS repeat-associated core domain-containing protein n=1 Tax=Lysobacter sp. BMK333-48F3 TaxID=2867962 RepID=UPI001C8CCDED|nr:RHS repeat-associated core domain-containing protein [Lysobacter sp. BMK333-48F3]MBX9399792.1 DUF6531 domain-containing protein [Lysobacter sp. BMK333-48F3]
MSSTNVRVDGACATYEDARQACLSFLASMNQQSGCMAGSGYYTAGWFRSSETDAQGSWIWYYGGFHSPPVIEAKPAENAGPPACPDQCHGDPINVGTGNKFESRTEYSGEGAFPLTFKWTYNSFSAPDVLRTEAKTLGRNRTHSYSSSIVHYRTVGMAYVARPDGKVVRFADINGVWTADADVNGRLTRTVVAGATTGWEYDDGKGMHDFFDAQGRLIRIVDPSGFAQDLSYSASTGLLERVTDVQGRTIEFVYNTAKLIARLNLPDGYLAFDYSPAGDLSRVEYADGSFVGYLYNEAGLVASGAAPGLLTGVVDEAQSRYASTTYDAKSRATSTYLGSGADLHTVAYGLNGDVVQQAVMGMPGGSTYTMGIEVRGGVALPMSRTTTCSDCVPTPKQYTYAADGRPDVVTTAGVQADYDYSSRGQLVRRIDAANDASGTRRLVEIDWHPQFVSKPIERRTFDNANALVAKSKWSYNTRGQRLTSTQIDPATNAERTTTTSYCEAADVTAGTCPIVGLLKSVDGPRSDVADVVSYTYYASDDPVCATVPATCAYRKGDLWKVVDALGHTTEYLRYDTAGRLLSSKDANGVVTDLEYYPRGWLKASKVRGANAASETDDVITRYEYDLIGQVKKVVQPDGAFVRYDYDAAHRLSDVYDNAGNRIHYTVDAAGNRTQEDTRDANGALKRTLSRIYNQLGQLKTAKTADGHPTAFTYDAAGNGDLTTDALNRKTDNDYDPLNRLAKTLQDVGGINAKIEYQYDALDRLTQVNDPKGLNTTYGYNGFGDQVQLSSPDTGVTTRTFNAAGQVATKQDANDANPHTYTYDALGRPKTVSYGSGANDVEYDYDTVNAACTTGETFAVGRVTAMRTEGTELKYCYDRFGRVVRKVQSVDAQSFTLRYAYTLAGELSALTYPDGAVADYVRDAQGRIVEIGVTAAGGVRSVLLNNVGYLPFGPATGWTYGNGRSLSRTYDLDYRAKTIFDPAAGGLSLAYGYNEVGELTELKDGLQSAFLAKYDYDALGRLKITRDGPTGTPLETYGYDATGNRTSLLRAGTATTYSYPATSHRLTDVGGIARGYDAVGNTTSIGGAAKEFVYNANDRMSQVKLGGVVSRSYRYNAKGERVAATNGVGGSVAVYTLYDEAGHWVGDYASDGMPNQQAVWFSGSLVGIIISAGTAQNLDYVQSDHLGTPRAVIDANRNVVIWSWGAKGEAFGNDTPNQDPDQDGAMFAFDLRFPGQKYDAAAALNYNYFRDYDAALGRYVQSDPVGLLGGVSTFVYVGGNPLAWVDSLGLAKDKTEMRWSYCSAEQELQCQRRCAPRKLISCRVRAIKATSIVGGTPVKGWVNKELSCNCEEPCSGGACPVDVNAGSEDVWNNIGKAGAAACGLLILIGLSALGFAS